MEPERPRAAGHRRGRRADPHIGEALPANQLALSQRDHKLAGREAALAQLHRRRPADLGEFGVEQRHEPQRRHQLPGDREPRIRRQRFIVGADLDPSGAAVTVSPVHPQGDLHSLTWRVHTAAMIPTRSDRKAEKPRQSGAFLLQEPATRPAGSGPGQPLSASYSRM